jgi:hypothetical protein
VYISSRLRHSVDLGQLVVTLRDISVDEWVKNPSFMEDLMVVTLRDVSVDEWF